MRDINVLPTWLYYLFDSEGANLYIGATCHLPSRLEEHSRKPWWGSVDSLSAECFPDREQALAWEAMEIRGVRPVWNREVPPMPVLRSQWCTICASIGQVEGTPDEVVSDFQRGLIELDAVKDRLLCPFCIHEAAG